MWRPQARAEGLTLLKADNKTGYFGVHLKHPGYSKPYEARVSRGGTLVSLGSFRGRARGGRARARRRARRTVTRRGSTS